MRAFSQALAGLALLLFGCSESADATGSAGGGALSEAGSSGADGAAAAGSAAGSAGALGRAGTQSEAGGSSTGGAGGISGDPAGGGAGSVSGAGGAGDESEMKPPGPIDYRMWSLQLPIGSGTSPTTIKPAELLAGFQNEYFYPADDGGQMFMDPPTGITTSGSTRCRTEMREAKLEGGQAAWSASAINRMTVSGKIVKGGGATITIGQILNGTDSFPLVEFEWSSGKKGFQLFYEEAKGAGNTIPLDTAWPENERYTFTLELSNNELLVSVNGKQVYSRKPGASILTKQFYFKFGNYDQNTSAGPISTTPHSIVEAYSVDVLHQ